MPVAADGGRADIQKILDGDFVNQEMLAIGKIPVILFMLSRTKCARDQRAVAVDDSNIENGGGRKQSLFVNCFQRKMSIRQVPFVLNVKNDLIDRFDRAGKVVGVAAR